MGFGVADGLSCVLCWVIFCYTSLMASGLLTVPFGDQMLNYQHPAVGLPPLFTIPSRRSARHLNILSVSVDLRIFSLLV